MMKGSFLEVSIGRGLGPIRIEEGRWGAAARKLAGDLDVASPRLAMILKANQRLQLTRLGLVTKSPAW